jgi:hypothetical protein
MIPHDQLFKRLLGTYFREFLELFFPQVVDYTDLSTLTPADKEMPAEVENDETLRVADLVYKARFKEQNTYFILHVEPQARSEGDFPFRMLEYCVRLIKKYNRLKVYPIAIISWDKKTAAESGYQMKFPDLEVLNFNYRVIQLSLLDWHDYMNTANPVAAALMAKMKIVESERVQAKIACFKLLFGLELNQEEEIFIAQFIDYYLELPENDKTEFEQEYRKMDPKGADKMT